MSKINEVVELISIGRAKLVPAAVQGALDEGNEPLAILNAMIDAMGVVGEKFKNNEIFVPEMLVCTGHLHGNTFPAKVRLKSDETSAELPMHESPYPATAAM